MSTTPARPPITPPTIAPVLSDPTRACAVEDGLELEDEDEDNVFWTELDDGGFGVAVDDAKGSEDTALPFSRNSPAFLLQQAIALVMSYTYESHVPQQKLPSAQNMTGVFKSA